MVQTDPIHDRHSIWILRPTHNLYRSITFFSCTFKLNASFSEVHQDLIDSQTVQPGGESRLSAKASDFAKQLNERFLRKVLRLGDVLCHAQTYRINATMM